MCESMCVHMSVCVRCGEMKISVAKRPGYAKVLRLKRTKGAEGTRSQ